MIKTVAISTIIGLLLAGGVAFAQTITPTDTSEPQVYICHDTNGRSSENIILQVLPKSQADAELKSNPNDFLAPEGANTDCNKEAPFITPTVTPSSTPSDTPTVTPSVAVPGVPDTGHGI